MNTDANKDAVEIRDLIERWAQAVRDRNMPAILASHSTDMLMFDVPPPTLLQGIEAYERSWLPLFKALGDHGVWEVRDLVIHAGDNVAFATALIDCVGKEKLEVRFTVGLRKLAGQWSVVHEHHSVPSP